MKARVYGERQIVTLVTSYYFHVIGHISLISAYSLISTAIFAGLSTFITLHLTKCISVSLLQNIIKYMLVIIKHRLDYCACIWLACGVVGVAGGNWLVSSLSSEDPLEFDDSSSSGMTGNWNESERFSVPGLLLFEFDLATTGGDFFTGATANYYKLTKLVFLWILCLFR